MRSAEHEIAAIAAATARDRVLIAARRGEVMEKTGDQLAALLDLSAAMDEARIPYVVIGGIAVGIHSATPRATNDVDVAVPTSDQPGVGAVLSAAGFELTGSFEHSMNFKHRSGEPVQVAFDLLFDPMIERAETVEVGTRTIRVVTREDLIAMKERAAGDPARRRSKALRDRADIELLRGDVPSPDEGW